jgi:TPR repeat protein
MSSLHFCTRCWLPVFAVVFCLGGLTAHGEGKPSADKIAEYRKAAEQGNAAAQFNLGLCYDNGEGVVKDEVEAVKWYRKAAEQGLAQAQSNLGLRYASGEGVAKDEVEAAKWYRKAAEQGHTQAQSNLGVCYAYGQGVLKNKAEAVKWYRKAAEKGLDSAQLNLGGCYFRGEGVEKDKVEAVKWFRKSAEQGLASAQLNLGNSYQVGEGVVKDAVEAVKWYRKAAEQGLADAQVNLGNGYHIGEGVVKDDVEAAKWIRKAAEQGDATAQCNLGGCYYLGEGVVKNQIESYKWVLLAAAQGNELAKKNMPFFESQLSSAQRAEGQRLAQEWEARHAKREAGQGEERRSATESSDAEPKVTGTGFLITKNGYLVTNHHVVKDSDKVRVQTASGLLDAVIIRTDAASDLALLKVAGTFDALPVVSSRNSRLGSTVATVGFPNIGLQGFEPKLSKGDISSLAGMQDDVKQFQISVPIQHGNSGGALVDERGNVVGVVCAQLSQKAALETTGTLAQNVNYAIKSSYLLSFLEAVPEVSGGLLDARTNDQKFEAVVDDVKKATVLIIGY